MTTKPGRKAGPALPCNPASAERKLSKQKLEEKFAHGSQLCTGNGKPRREDEK